MQAVAPVWERELKYIDFREEVTFKQVAPVWERELKSGHHFQPALWRWSLPYGSVN